MALFQQNTAGPDVASQVAALRSQGLTDSVIVSELGQKGVSLAQVQQAINQLDSQADASLQSPPSFGPEAPAYPTEPQGGAVQMAGDDTLYARVEEIAEGLIDEKWDDLIGEVKKIITWKQKIEERQTRMESDLAKLKEDFKTLHQGVLGKLEDYDTRMKDVGTELHAVGKVFKDVIPQFVENVKELKHITQEKKKE